MHLNLSRFAQAALVTVVTIPVTACVTELPGIFYETKLLEPPPEASCDALATALLGRLPLRSLSRTRTPQHDCIVELGSLVPAPSQTVRISSDREAHRLVVSVEEFRSGGRAEPSEASIVLAENVLSILKDRLPSATFTRFKGQQGLFAP